MSTAKAPSQFIELDVRGRAFISGTSVKVVEIALDQIANGWSAQEIYLQHAPTLSMAQIHAALSHYYDCQADYDAEIERQINDIEAMRKQVGDSPFAARMRRLGRM
jgi:uncharacterized protein (DUF433 family)